ncbi:Endonuclease [Salmonella enterica subsp. arizonae]|uniref:Endonuclease n=1 Tax=Salmonella enterica subsp. arizonae TaxID=59203 RepID=A0A379T2W5_SALER|nr:Endonuclease [Salmonella enterica subsp. arizonae]
MCRWLLPGLLGLVLCAPVPNTYAATVEAGFSPEGTALQLVLKTIETAQQEIRLMGYSFTSPEGGQGTCQGKTSGCRCGRGSGLES